MKLSFNFARRILQLCNDRLYRRVLMGRAILFLLNRFFPQVDLLSIRNGQCSTLVSTQDRAVSLYMLADPYIEDQIFEKIFSILERHQIKRSGAFFDIGANIGTSTLAASRQPLFTHIHAFEPVPYNIEKLEKNVAINGLHNKITVLAYGVSDRKDVVEISLNPNNFGDNRIEEPAHSLGGERLWEKIKIPTQKLDDYLADVKISGDHISLIWIDSQGHEGKILAGAEQLLAQRKTPLYTEFWPFGLKQAENDDLYFQLCSRYFRKFVDMNTLIEYSIEDLKLMFEMYQTEAQSSDLLLIP